MKERPIGSTRLEPDGYVVVKIGERPRKWVFEHRVVWERAHGPLPKGWTIHHRDENRSNNDPENLVACPTNGHHHKTYHLDKHRESGRNVGLSCLGKKHTPEARAHESAAQHKMISDGRKAGTHDPRIVAEVRRRLAAGERQADVSRALNVGKSSVWRIANGITYWYM